MKPSPRNRETSTHATQHTHTHTPHTQHTTHIQSCLSSSARTPTFISRKNVLSLAKHPRQCAFDGGPRALKPPGFHTTTREPKRAHLSAPALQTPPKFNEKTPREKKSETVAGKGKHKSEILGGLAEGGLVEGRSSVRWSRDPNQQQPQPATTTPTPPEVNECGPKSVGGGSEGVPKGGPLGVGPLLP